MFNERDTRFSIQWCVAVAVSLVLTLLTAQAGYSQVSTGTVTGFLRDQSGAVMPGVTITVTNVDRNTSQTTITNDLGSYVVPALNPGNYSVAAELPGFKKSVREGLTLQ